MGIAPVKQNFQDWITQQWVILFGKKIIPNQNEWLLGPFGKTDGIGQKFINQLALKENLDVDKSNCDKGIIQSVNQLNFSKNQLSKLSKNVIDFYENTSNYNLDLEIKWNPFFKLFGWLLNLLFSNRIQQLNIPMNNSKGNKALKSEIIHLINKKTKVTERTIWLRTFKNSEKVVYSGVYETCTIPNGRTCIKAVFPLPNGNATVILNLSIGGNGELILTSSGKKLETVDSIFYSTTLKETYGLNLLNPLKIN